MEEITIRPVAPVLPAAEVARGNGRTAASNGAVPLSVLVEGMLFVAGGPVAVADLARALEVDRRTVQLALAELAEANRGRGVRLQQVNGQVQMVSAPEAAEAIGRFLGLESSARLSSAALEVLAMVAYRQPVTRPEVDALRGVNSEAALRTLMARGLVEPIGRRETVGHPIEYATTFLFLEYFGLTGLHELPPVEAFVTPEAVPGPAQTSGLAEVDILTAAEVETPRDNHHA